MEFALSVKPQANKELEKLPESDKLRVKTACSLIQSNPFQGKKLKGKYKSYYSVRVWPYRIVYKLMVSSREVIVAEIVHRGQAYRKRSL